MKDLLKDHIGQNKVEHTPIHQERIESGGKDMLKNNG